VDGLVTLTAGRARLRLAPAVGGAVVDWVVADAAGRPVPLLRPTSAAALAAGEARGLASYPLVPLSNRVAGNRFSFAGLSYGLPALLGEQSIHGAGWQLPWEVVEAGADRAVLRLSYPGGVLWPFAFVAEQRFALLPDGLRLEMTVRNSGEQFAPVAMGAHPFFPRTPGARLRFAARQVWLQDGGRIPTRLVDVPAQWDHRDGMGVGQVELDHCFADWSAAGIEWPEHGLGLAISADPVFGHVIVYTPAGRDFFAFEPVSNMTDGVNRIDGVTEHGMAVLKPGEEIAGAMRFMVEALG
jgi:aldose 1-epimerase